MKRNSYGFPLVTTFRIYLINGFKILEKNFFSFKTFDFLIKIWKNYFQTLKRRGPHRGGIFPYPISMNVEFVSSPVTPNSKFETIILFKQ